jgi:hypothetical protein
MDVLRSGIDLLSSALLWIQDKKLDGLLLSITTITTLLIIRAVLTRVVRKFVYSNAYKTENADSFMATWKYVWTAVIAIFGIISLSGSLKTLGISAGFLGTRYGRKLCMGRMKQAAYPWWT